MTDHLTYKQAGVDIDAGNEFVRLIKPLTEATKRQGVLGSIGGFGGLFQLDTKKYKDPVLVSGTDGVGTKLKLAFMMNKHDTIGIDLVAMCVNDIVVCGAEPLFFLDYLATGKLVPAMMVDVMKGISEGCRSAGCALIGGETAEMPAMYQDSEYDLAGFSVGVVERDRIIDGSRVRPGDKIIGLASSGLHSNGYSLARKVVFDKMGFKVTDTMDILSKTIGEELLTPTRIYVKTVLHIINNFDVKGVAHITGGGLTENIPRVLPEGAEAVLYPGRWNAQAIFYLIEKWGNIERDEMYRDFNMGIGMVMILPDEQVEDSLKELERCGEEPYIIGEITEGSRKVVYEKG
ncbi:MAG: phosphoribosylformylglycinamidine cyclo-ligase [Nitrospirae bacterium]|nr:phosphoribosylformylglycinamidine cyclo-ligase [Nitrospirota bacterium]